MIKTFIASILCFAFLTGTGQEDTTSIKEGSITIRKKPREIDYWPHIAGNYSGEIEPAFLCSENGIRNNVKWQVLSYTIIFNSAGGEHKEKVTGNVLPDHLCKLVSKLSNGSMVYIQDIYALNHNNQKVKLNSLRYEIIGSTAGEHHGKLREVYPGQDDD